MNSHLDLTPDAWAFQHTETGRITVVYNDGINNAESFASNNPRYHLVEKLYAHSTVNAAIRGAMEQAEEWWRKAIILCAAVDLGLVAQETTIDHPEIKILRDKWGGTPSMIIGAAIRQAREEKGETLKPWHYSKVSLRGKEVGFYHGNPERCCDGTDCNCQGFPPYPPDYIGVPFDSAGAKDKRISELEAQLAEEQNNNDTIQASLQAENNRLKDALEKMEAQLVEARQNGRNAVGLRTLLQRAGKSGYEPSEEELKDYGQDVAGVWFLLKSIAEANRERKPKDCAHFRYCVPRVQHSDKEIEWISACPCAAWRKKE